MYYHIVTYGCQMNVHESEKIAGRLEELGYENIDDRDKADIIVFNTCAIREGAENRAFGNIGALKQQKHDNPNKIIIVAGCMTQQEDVAKHIYKLFPFVDIVVGVHNVSKINEYIKEKIENKNRILKYSEQESVVEDKKILRTSGDNAWVNIMYGCNNFCTYCIVPYVRGREVSREKSNIINEIKGIIATKQYKTITLLGQNVNSYGTDKEGNGTFAELLNDICGLDGDFKLTFMTSHPKDLTDDVIDIIANNDKMIKDIHLPVQSGSNNILKAMNRKYTREHYLKIVEKIKQKIPTARITTDIIVGFPNETEQDFMDTVDLIKQVEFNNIFAYMYSRRSGTVADKMENQIDEDVKNFRVNYLLDLEKQIKEQRKG